MNKPFGLCAGRALDGYAPLLYTCYTLASTPETGSEISSLTGAASMPRRDYSASSVRPRGWEPYHVYREEVRSALVDAISKRPAFRKLIDNSGKNKR